MYKAPTAPNSGHVWDKVTFYANTCQICNSMLHFWSYAVQCKNCNFTSHSACLDRVPRKCISASPFIPAELELSSTGHISIQMDNVKKEGSLELQVDGQWKKHHFVILDGTLYFFDTIDLMLTGTFSGSLPIEGSSVAPTNNVSESQSIEYGFELTIQDKVHKFKARKLADRDEWISAIRDYSFTDLVESWLPISKEDQLNWTKIEWPQLTRSNYPNVKTFALTEKYKKLPKNIAELIFVSESYCYDPHEITYFRAKMQAVIEMKTKIRVRIIQAAITNTPLPDRFPDTLIVWFIKPRENNSCKLNVKSNAKLCDVLEQEVLLRFVPMDMSCSWIQPVKNYVVKVGEGEQFIFDTNVALHSLEYVRECIVKSQKICFYILNSDEVSDAPAENEMIHSVFGNHSAEQEAKEELMLKLPRENIKCYSSNDINSNFEFAVIKLDNFNVQKHLTGDLHFTEYDVTSGKVMLCVVAGIYFGDEIISKQVHTQAVPCGKDQEIKWNDVLRIPGIRYADIPKESRICIVLYALKKSEQGWLSRLVQGTSNKFIPIGWVNFNLMDFRGIFRSGQLQLRLWPGFPNCLGSSCSVDNIDTNAVKIVLEFIKPPHPIAKIAKGANVNVIMKVAEQQPPEKDDLEKINILLKKDVIYRLKPEEKELLWQFRYYLLKLNINRTNFTNSLSVMEEVAVMNTEAALSKLLLATCWKDNKCVEEMHEILKNWPAIPPVSALELLDVRFSDTQVRKFAVNCLRDLSDRALVEFLPQLVQVTKSEPYHYCALSEFLCVRAIRNIIVAHPFFWHLKGEIHVPNVSVKFKLLLEALLLSTSRPGAHEDTLREDITSGMEVMDKLADIAISIRTIPSATERDSSLRDKLKTLSLPKSFKLPSDPKFSVNKLVIEKCKVMQSNTRPLWLCFQDASSNPSQVIFKAGDDLRTDILILQMMRIMDSLWKQEGLDLHMQPYRAVCTGDKVGVIEVITAAQTSSNIQHIYGGGGPLSALTVTALRDWIKDRNSTQESFNNAVRNFTFSCAGYCVATYILGIGDRHNDNIMCSETGNMFHIDFGFVLGNRTLVPGVGISRESAPFVLTQEFAVVMGGVESKNFKKFEMLCCKAYNILRKHAGLFLTLFVMMLSADLDQLKSLEDLEYVREALSVDLTDDEAEKKFKGLISDSLNNKMVTVNYITHDLGKFF